MYRLRTYYAAAPCTCVLYLNEYFLQWYRTHLNSNPSMEGHLPYNVTLPALQVPNPTPGSGSGSGSSGPAALPPTPPGPPGPPDPSGLPIPMPLRPVPIRPAVYQPRFQMPPPSCNVPPMQSLLPQGIRSDMLQNANNQESTHTENSQPSNFTSHIQSQHLLQNGLLLPERHYYPRNTVPLPSEHYKKYMPFYQPGYQEPPTFDSTHYNYIDILTTEPRPDLRMEQNNALVKDRHIEQTWNPVNEAFFDGPTNVKPTCQSYVEDKELEEELEALVRRIDTEFKTGE